MKPKNCTKIIILQDLLIYCISLSLKHMHTHARNLNKEGENAKRLFKKTHKFGERNRTKDLQNKDK